MKKQHRVLRGWIAAVGIGIVVPFGTAMLLMLYREVSSAIVLSALNLSKPQAAAVMDRIRLFGNWGAAPLNVVLTALAAYLYYRSTASPRRWGPLATGAVSAATMLVLGSIFSLSFNPAVLPLGLWYFCSLFAAAAAGLAGGSRGSKRHRQKQRLLGIADLRSTARAPQALMAAAGAAARHIPVNYMCLAGVGFGTGPPETVEWADRDYGDVGEGLRRFCESTADRLISERADGIRTTRDLSSEERAGLRHLGFRSAAVAPVAASGGALAFLSRRRGAFPKRSWQIAFITSQVLLSLENMALFEETREASVLGERQRVAREIHDTVAQNLMGIILNLEAARDGAPSDTVDKHIDLALQTARETLEEARSIVWALKPPMLDGHPLPTALSRTLEGWSRVNGIEARFDVEGAPHRLPTAVEVTTLRVLQEACANIAKHAGASTARVVLGYAPTQVTLRVKDNGHGFDPASAGVAGFGLTTMRQRVEALGGNLTIETTVGRGSEVSIRIPADMQEEAAAR